MKEGVHIIECLHGDDPGSEGRMLKHVFNLMEVRSKYVHVDTVDQLIKEMRESKFSFLHITTHGSLNDQDVFQGWWTPAGTGTNARISRLIGKLKCTAIISTACKSGNNAFGNYVVDVLGSKYFVGPSGSPDFYNSAFFSHIFYHKLFKTRQTVSAAFRSYKENYKNPFKFKLFS